MNLHKFIFAVYPYIVLSVFIIGSWIRYDREQYTWKTDSSQLLSKKNMVFASNFFHIGILAIFGGHFAGLVLPHGLWLALGVSDIQHQWLAIGAGTIFGAMCLLGGGVLWLRRLTNERVKAAGRTSDMFVISWLMITLLLGLVTIPVSIEHANHSNPEVMMALAYWVQSVLSLNPQPELLEGVDAIFKVHIFFGLTVFLIFPFTRLVHVLTAPLNYLGRAYQVVRAKRRA